MTVTATARASMVRGQLDAVERLAGDASTSILARMPPDSLEQIRGAPGSGWLPLQVAVDLHSAIAEVLDEAELVQFYRDLVGPVSKIPLFASLARGVLRLFASPGGVYRMMPRAWKASARGGEQIHIEVHGDDTATLLVHDVPRDLDLHASVCAWKGAVLGVLDLCGAKGDAAFEMGPENELSYQVIVRWGDDAAK